MRHAFNPEPTPPPSDDRWAIAARRELLAGALALVAVMVSGLVFGAYLASARAESASGLLDCLNAVASVPGYTAVGAIAGGFAASGVIRMISYWHYFRGFHRCRCCGRALHSPNDRCCFTTFTQNA